MPCSRGLRRRLPPLLTAALLGLWLSPHSLCAQTFDATTLRKPTELGVVWLVKAGDDPAYARSDYDDSQWLPVNARVSLKQYFPTARPDVVWYRLHVKVDPGETGLALQEWNLSSAFEIYVNGVKLLENGSVSPFRRSTSEARIIRSIPDAAIATGSLVIALRVHIAPGDWAVTDPGLNPSNLLIGERTAIVDYVWMRTIGSDLLLWVFQTSGLGLGIIALALFLAQRQRREYLWMFLLFLCLAAYAPLEFGLLFHNFPTWTLLVGSGFLFFRYLLLTLMYLAFLRLPMSRWIKVILALIAVGYFLNTAMQLSGVNLTAIEDMATFAPAVILAYAIIPILLIVHWRRGNQEAGILLIPAILSSLTTYFLVALLVVGEFWSIAAADRIDQAVLEWTVGPFMFDVTEIFDCLWVGALALILVLRSTRIAEQEAQMETELEAARQVQQILLPEQIGDVAGFSIEAAYVPAREVGGDFFQILPQADGSLLLVVGDVAGKGLPAAMLVSVLVGAIRAAAEYTSDPTELLANLNQRLVARVAASFATALAARIQADSSIVLANAGHLPPYLDGREVDVPGALPLGAISGASYEAVHFALPPGGKLTFYSDGIVEAMNPNGELLGFDRGRELSLEPVAVIVEAARKFGQQDDMTVIVIAREAPKAPSSYRAKELEFGEPALAR